MGSRIPGTWRLAVCCASLLTLGAAEMPPPVAPALRILSDRPLPPALAEASDVRWASDTSVYLAMLRRGAFEASIDLDRPMVVKMIGGMNEPGGAFSYALAASSDFLVTSGPLWITWRTLADPARSEEAFDSIHDFDVAGDRLLIVAARRDAQGNFAPEGALAWLGSLRKKLADLRPVTYDANGPGGKTIGICSTFQMGGARFLRDGSFVVVPGVQSGVHLYSAEGRLLRTWDSAALGLDADCASLTPEQARQLAVQFLQRAAWLNQRRTLDEILVLPEGIGLLVRSVSGGKATWELKVLRPDGSVRSYAVPVRAHSDLSHLKGDVRGDRIVLLMSAFERDGMESEVSRLILAEVPDREVAE